MTPCTSRGPGLTPGRVIHTPSTAWSSSPVRRVGGLSRANSFSPPDQMGSPMFSPIARGRREGREESDTEEEEMDSSSRDLRVSVTPAVREPDPPCPPCPIPEGEQGNLTADMRPVKPPSFTRQPTPSTLAEQCRKWTQTVTHVISASRNRPYLH